MTELKQKGFLLLELIITIAILIFLIPSVYSTFLYLQKNTHKLQQDFIKETELNFIKNVLFEDFKSFELKKSTDKIYAFTTVNNDTIEFGLKNNRVSREKIKFGKKKGYLFYLNNALKVDEIYIKETSSRNIAVSLVLPKSEKREFIVFLANFREAE